MINQSFPQPCTALPPPSLKMAVFADGRGKTAPPSLKMAFFRDGGVEKDESDSVADLVAVAAGGGTGDHFA